MSLTPDFSELDLIDRDQFDMLVETGEDEAAEMIQELVDLFTSESGPKMDELIEVARLGNRQRVNRLSHALAGAAGNLGGNRLSRAARDLENNLNELSIEEIKARAAQLKSLYDETVSTFEEEIAALSEE
jgi:HPt (histidine-containing phosphotransfer) domain-containing protein